MSQEPELGYQYLNTAFTGAVNPALSGNAFFPFIFPDTGSAGTLRQKELQ
jgi:hypothetical protein